MTEAPRVFGLVLAGGRSRRFGREKAVAMLGGRPLIAWVVAALQASGVERLAVSARAGSGAEAWAAGEGLASLPDPPGGALAEGPLAGVLEGLRWAQGQGADWLLTSPCDLPYLPPDLGLRLMAGRSTGGATATTADGLQPLCSLWPVAALSLLEAETSHPPVRRVLERLAAAPVDVSDRGAFRNLNTEAALAAGAAP